VAPTKTLAPSALTPPARLQRSQPEHDMGPVLTSPSAPSPATVQRTIDSREALRQALQPRVVPAVVQAAPAEGGTSAARENAGPVASTSQERGTQEGEDIEALARDVYRLLRRRLLIERERGQGRV
jgi:hypothetical protein